MGSGLKSRVLPALLAALMLAGTATADEVESLSFVAPSQSTWGPGGTKAAFNSSGKVGGATHLGYTSKASTGTVRASLGGNLKPAFLQSSFISQGRRKLCLKLFFCCSRKVCSLLQ